MRQGGTSAYKRSLQNRGCDGRVPCSSKSDLMGLQERGATGQPYRHVLSCYCRPQMLGKTSMGAPYVRLTRQVDAVARTTSYET